MQHHPIDHCAFMFKYPGISNTCVLFSLEKHMRLYVKIYLQNKKGFHTVPGTFV